MLFQHVAAHCGRLYNRDVSASRFLLYETLCQLLAIMGAMRLGNPFSFIIKHISKDMMEYYFNRFENEDTAIIYNNKICNTNLAEDEETNKEEVSVEFSVFEFKEEFERRFMLINAKAFSEDIEDALFYLSRIGALKIEGGFMVLYNARP